MTETKKDYVKQIVLDEYEIGNRINTLAEEISDHYKLGIDCEPIVMLGVLNGAFMFHSKLCQKLCVPNVIVDFISVSTYSGTESTGQFKVNLLPKCDLKGKRVVVVEDIVDTGFTLSKLIPFLQQQGATNVEVCTLLLKNDAQKHQLVVPKFVGFRIKKDAFVVGYGLDYNQRYRSLAYIGELAFR